VAFGDAYGFIGDAAAGDRWQWLARTGSTRPWVGGRNQSRLFYRRTKTPPSAKIGERAMQNTQDQDNTVLHFIGENLLWGIELPYFAAVPEMLVAENINIENGPVPVMAPPRVKQIVANDTDNQTDAKIVRLFGK
jgi:hypothetical protein